MPDPLINLLFRENWDMAIYNVSKDPVHLKKIPLKVWRLWDEIESIIQNQMAKGQTTEEKLLVEKLTSKYSPGKEADSPQEETFEEFVSPPKEKIFPGKAFLSEINMERMSFFCNESFVIGSALVLQFQVPNPFKVNVIVVDYKNYNGRSKLIRAHKLPYRISIHFTFLRKSEKKSLRNFLKSVTSKKIETDKIQSQNILLEKKKVA